MTNDNAEIDRQGIPTGAFLLAAYKGPEDDDRFAHLAPRESVKRIADDIECRNLADTV